MKHILSIPKCTLLAVFFILQSMLFAQPSDNYGEEEKQRFDYRRIDPNNHPPLEEYAQPKEQVFPLNWRNPGTGVWTELNPGVPRVDYIGIDFINPDTGWACGGSGAIIKTTNGGDDWTISETPINNLLLKIHSYNGHIVIATGYDGIILRSSNGGETFEQMVSGVGNGIDLWGLQMLNDTLGWVSGMNQTLLKTTDTGLTWQMITPGLNQHYWSLDFLNEQYGMIACSDGYVLKSTDGGSTWVQTLAGDTRSLYSIDIIDSMHIVSAGEREPQIQFEGGKNVYSSNGGATWIQNPDIPTYTDANWIEFLVTDTGYAITVDHGIYKTTNRGQSWFGVGGGGEWHIDLTEDGTGYSGGDGLNIYKRTDGLENWNRIFLNDNFNDVHFTSETKGFAISGSLYKTNNGGTNWQRVSGAPGGNDIFFFDSLTGFIAGTHKSSNGGETWYSVNGGGTKVFFVNDQVGWSIGGRSIYKTTNLGEEWILQFTHAASNFSSIYFVDSLYGWVSGGRPQKTTDGGNTWVEQTNTNIWNSDDVYFTNWDIGWFGKYSSISNSLFKTTDGGLNWIGIPEVIGARKFYFFPDPIHWLTIGFSRYYLTTDYGSNWIEFTEDVPAGLVSFYAPNNNLGFSVGNSGLILKYDDTTYVPVELVSFKGELKYVEIVLSWITASELNNYGFEIQKSLDNKNWEKIGFIIGKGTSTEINYYSFSDPILNADRISYRLKQIDYNGSFNYSKVITVTIENLTSNFELSQNFPNPFNSSTVITYQIPTDEFVFLKLYDVLGKEVKILISENKKAGYYSASLNANDLSSGIYFYQLRTKDFLNTKKMILLR